MEIASAILKTTNVPEGRKPGVPRGQAVAGPLRRAINMAQSPEDLRMNQKQLLSILPEFHSNVLMVLATAL